MNEQQFRTERKKELLELQAKDKASCDEAVAKLTREKNKVIKEFDQELSKARNLFDKKWPQDGINAKVTEAWKATLLPKPKATK